MSRTPDTWAELLDRYDEALISWRELDYSAQPRYEALRVQVEAALSAAPPPGVWHDPGSFRCVRVGECSTVATTEAGYRGPWSQLVEMGWRRDGDGAWQCPAHTEARVATPSPHGR